MDVVDWVLVVVGFALVAWIVLDSFETLLATSITDIRISFTSGYYRFVWAVCRWVCRRVRDDDRRERWLARFGPVSFVGLLASWTLLEIFGWALVWWGFRHQFAVPLGDFGLAWYYSGVVYFSIGFGDVLPASGGVRALTILEGFSGLATLGLVIGYLPTLLGAYSARERQLLLLDDLTDARITPVSLVRSHLKPDGDLTELNAVFDAWSAWCAEIYDSHTSLPVLIWFRSKHRGHSWVTALGVVTDAAIAFAAAVPSADQGSALRLQRQAVRLVRGLAQRVGVEPVALEPLSARFWSIGYTSMQAAGLELRDFDDSLGRIRQLRAEFHPYMEAFIDELMAPRGFWGVTAADSLGEPTTLDFFGEE